MSAVLVAVPVLRGKRRFHIDKGRPWSAVEHLVLVALAAHTLTASDLAQQSRLPRRVVIEILIRLMRVGWVEVSHDRGGIRFQASRAGSAASELNDLPAAPKRITRWMSFLVDQVTGAVFRSRDLQIVHRNDLAGRENTDRLVWISPRDVSRADDIRTVADVLLEEDEHLAFVETGGERLAERFALVAVRDGVIERSLRLPEDLKRAVLEAAAKAPPTADGHQAPHHAVGDNIPRRSWFSQKRRPAAIASEDVILGGANHLNLLTDIIRKSRRYLVIHSCFIRPKEFAALRDLLLEAARRDVKVEVLWGADPDRSEEDSTAQTVVTLRKDPEIQKLPNFRIHPFSTLSHGKFVIADDATTGRFVAALGSCNWLSSRFDSIDVSLKIRDPLVISDLTYLLAELVKGAGGSWTALARNFAALASHISQISAPAVQRAEAELVIGPTHAEFIRRARDEAQTRFTVVSHRLGEVANAAVIVPAAVAAKKRNVEVDLLYGRVTGAVNAELAERLRRSAGADGVALQPVQDPRLHAKLLAWDDSDLLITSQNWLSGDPTWANPGQEIGIHISAPEIARDLRLALEAAMRQASMTAKAE